MRPCVSVYDNALPFFRSWYFPSGVISMLWKLTNSVLNLQSASLASAVFIIIWITWWVCSPRHLISASNYEQPVSLVSFVFHISWSNGLCCTLEPQATDTWMSRICNPGYQTRTSRCGTRDLICNLGYKTWPSRLRNLKCKVFYQSRAQRMVALVW